MMGIRVTRQRNCEICGEMSKHFVTKVYPGFPKADYSRCQVCDFLHSRHIANAPSAEIADYYRSVSFEEADSGYVARASIALLVLKKFAARTEASTQKILDYGCGTALFVRKCRENGFEAVGCDRYYSGQPSDVSQWVASEESLDQSREQFDLVTAWEVVEHSAPVLGFEDISRYVKPQGFLAFSTWIFNPLEHGGGWEYLVPGHCSIYSYKSLEIVRTRLGFTKVHSIRHPFPRGMKYMLIGEIWKKTGQPVARRPNFAQPLRDAMVGYLGARIAARLYAPLVRLVFAGTDTIY